MIYGRARPPVLRTQEVERTRMKSPEELAAAKAARRAEQQIDGPKAMREYRSAEQTARDRAARLRAERLEREANPSSARSK